MGEEDLIICRCEEVTMAEVEEAIGLGLTTLDEIKRFTRAGMGLCQGKTCRRLIANTLSRKTKIPLSEIIPSTYRPPVRPILLGVLSNRLKDCAFKGGEE
jgi:bacterioferritin-associated ferredoxin